MSSENTDGSDSQEAVPIGTTTLKRMLSAVYNSDSPLRSRNTYSECGGALYAYERDNSVGDEPVYVYYHPGLDETIMTTAEGDTIGMAGSSAGFEGNVDIAELGRGSGALLPVEIRHLRGILPSDADAGELNYLAAKLRELGEYDQAVFNAVIEAGWHSGSVAEMINVTENLGNFVLRNENAKQFGGRMLDADAENCAKVLDALRNSGDYYQNVFADYVERLQESADKEAYGRAVAEIDEGAFTKYGYLSETKFQVVYRGVQDLPDEYRALTDAAPTLDSAAPTKGAAQNANPLIKVDGLDLAAFLLGIHALSGDYMRDAKRNVQLLARSGADDFFVMVTPGMIMAAPTREVYHRDTHDSMLWMNAAEGPGVCMFALSVTERVDGRIVGNLYEMNLADIQDSIWDHGFDFTHIDAEMRDGTERVITVAEYYSMDQLERGQLKSWVKHYDRENEEGLSSLISGIRWACDENRQPMPAAKLISRLGESYMAAADNPQPGMLRLAQDAAREILAKDLVPVYRLLPKGAEKLAPIDAAKTGLNYSEFCEFAIRAEDLAGVEKWAVRSAGDMLRQVERSERNKTRGKGDETI